MYNYDMRLIISPHMICIYEEWQKDMRQKQHLFSYTTHKGGSAFLYSQLNLPLSLYLTPLKIKLIIMRGSFCH